MAKNKKKRSQFLKNLKPDCLYELFHVRKISEELDISQVSILGFFETEELVKEAIAKLSKMPGFKDCPEGFEYHHNGIDGYLVEEGIFEAYNSMYPAALRNV